MLLKYYLHLLPLIKHLQIVAAHFVLFLFYLHPLSLQAETSTSLSP